MIPPQNPAAPQPEEAGGDEGELVEPEPKQSCEYSLFNGEIGLSIQFR